MASTSKRKAIGEAEFDDTGGVKLAKKRRVRKQLIKEPKKSTPNLLMKLSGELRNQIYELALTDAGKSLKRQPYEPDHAGAILIGNRSFKVGGPDTWVVYKPESVQDGRRYSSCETQRVPAWREPGLLQVSKQIRQEAMGVYFEINSFRLSIGVQHISRGMEWLSRLHAKFGAAMFDKLHIQSTVMGAKWRATVPSWYSIANFVFQTPLPDVVDKDGPAADVEESKYWMRYFGVSTQTLRRMGYLAFTSMVTLSVRAKLGKMEHRRFQAEFRDWAFNLMSSNPRPRLGDLNGARIWTKIHAAMQCADPWVLPKGVIDFQSLGIHPPVRHRRRR
ncbi:uncharacterized protein LTR77_005803 [Saxophila tyrrhenica]|uniref:Uncharacterized protein n=1 Tax=Saxophila tyrrhenica TaxID=1690608 RepID=A0AAV9PDR7_9PEZI|nr:hypothetical protein LTR77_005803 [Saxophila tyrrhenica]